MKNMSSQPLWLTHLIKILLVFEIQLINKLWLACFLYDDMISYKAHFRPQISSNADNQVFPK